MNVVDTDPTVSIITLTVSECSTAPIETEIDQSR